MTGQIGLLDGQVYRPVGDTWANAINRALRQYGPLAKKMALEDFKRLVWAKVLVSDPETKRLVDMIASYPDEGLDILEKFFRDPSKTPSSETVARRLRDQSRQLEDHGVLSFSSGNGETERTYDDYAVRYKHDVDDYRSDLEARFSAALEATGQQWLPNEKITIDRGVFYGRVFMPDFVCYPLRITIELDSRKHHLNPDSFVSDRVKARALQVMGFVHLQFAGSELTQQGGISRAMQEIKSCVDARLTY